MITIMIIKITTIILTNHSPSGALQGQYKQIKINIGEKKQYLQNPMWPETDQLATCNAQPRN